MASWLRPRPADDPAVQQGIAARERRGRREETALRLLRQAIEKWLRTERRASWCAVVAKDGFLKPIQSTAGFHSLRQEFGG